MKSLTAMRKPLGKAGLPVVLLLASGIAVFSLGFCIYYGVLVKGLPYAHSDQLVALFRRSQGNLSAISLPDFQKVRASIPGESAALSAGSATATGLGAARVVAETTVTYNLFSLLGVKPLMGRSFSRSDVNPGSDGGADAAIISNAFWHAGFHGSPDAIGRGFELDGRPYVVVGIMPAGFWLADASTCVWVTTAHLRVPPKANHGLPLAANRFARLFIAIHRLPSAMSMDQMRARIGRARKELAADYPDWARDSIVAMPMLQWIAGDQFGSPLKLLLAVCAAIFLLALGDASAIVLAAAVSRRREFALRRSLGATPSNIAGLALREAAAPAAVAIVLGIAAAASAAPPLLKEAAAITGRPQAAEIGPMAIAFAAALGLLCLLLLSLVTAAAARLGQANTTLNAASGSLISGTGRSWKSLLCVQVCVTSLLVCSAALLWRSSSALQHRPLGFSPSGVLAFRVALPPASYPYSKVPPFFARLLAKLRSGPGVTAVGAVSGAPLSPYCCSTMDLRVREANGATFNARGTRLQSTLPGYFATAGIAVLAGRGFTQADGAPKAYRVAVVSAAFSRRFHVGVGSHLEPPPGQTNAIWSGWTVVGVVDDTVGSSLRTAAKPTLYLPANQIPFRSMTVLMRSQRRNLPQLAQFARRQLYSLDPNLPARNVAPLADTVTEALALPRFYALAMEALAVVSLLLAFGGLYGVATWLLSRRQRDIAIRVALGSGVPRALLHASGGLMLAAGLGLGLGLASIAALGGMIRPLLFQTSPADPATLAITAAIIAACTLATAWAGARKAKRLDLVALLRAE